MNVETFEQVWISSHTRSYARGFLEFYKEIFKVYQPETLCEFGIGGGGKHSAWTRCGLKAVIGLEYLSYPDATLGPSGKPLQPEQVEYWQKQLQKSQKSLAQILEEFPDCNIKFRYGVDAYDATNVAEELKVVGIDKFDIVVDDAGDKWPLMQNSKNVWMNHLTDDGIYVTETPDGNGTDFWNAFTYEEHLEHFRILAEYGVRVYNMAEYQPEESRSDEYLQSTYIGFWTKDFSRFDNLTERFAHCRVA